MVADVWPGAIRSEAGVPVDTSGGWQAPDAVPAGNPAPPAHPAGPDWPEPDLLAAAVPPSLLERLAELLGSAAGRAKLAAVQQLAARPRTAWLVREAQASLSWLEPSVAARLLKQLFDEGMIETVPGLETASGPESYRLSDEAQLLGAICAGLTGARVPHRRVVRSLAAAVALADASGAGDDAAYAPLVTISAVLADDLAAIERLLDGGAEHELLAAADLAAAHAADARALLEQQAELLARTANQPAHLAVQQHAVRAVTHADALAGEVIATLTGHNDPLVSGGEEADRRDLRDLVAALPAASLEALIGGQLRLPPAVPPADPVLAFTLLDEYLGRPEPVLVPLPEARELPVEPLKDMPDLVDLAADALRWLARHDHATLADWVVGGTWAEASARMAAVIEAWSRFGPRGDGSLALQLGSSTALEMIGRDEIGVISRTAVSARFDPAPVQQESR